MADRRNPTWPEVRKYLREQIEERRDELERGADVLTARGAISAYRDLLQRYDSTPEEITVSPRTFATGEEPS